MVACIMSISCCTITSRPIRLVKSAASARRVAAVGAREDETPEQTIDRLQARVRELEVETTKLATEREILRSAAKYFAGETNW